MIYCEKIDGETIKKNASFNQKLTITRKQELPKKCNHVCRKKLIIIIRQKSGNPLYPIVVGCVFKFTIDQVIELQMKETGKGDLFPGLEYWFLLKIIKVIRIEFSKKKKQILVKKKIKGRRKFSWAQQSLSRFLWEFICALGLPNSTFASRPWETLSFTSLKAFTHYPGFGYMDFVFWFLFIIVVHGFRFFFPMYNAIQSCWWSVSWRQINCGQSYKHLQARHLALLRWQIKVIYKSGGCIFCSKGFSKASERTNLQQV